MKRVAILGRGGAGKSALARQLGELTGLPVIELDTLFWQLGLTTPDAAQWAASQQELVRRDGWIIDGDLGPYDVHEPRLHVADAVIVLDYSLFQCARRSIRRSRERGEYWRWVIGHRRRRLPVLMASIATHAPGARRYVFRSPRAAAAFITGVSNSARGPRL